MSVDRDNVIQAFGWFKDLMDADNDAKLAGLSYTLPAATEYDLGGVKVGDGLEMDADDRLNVTISGGDTNVIEAISVDGTNQPPDANKKVNINLSAFAKKTDVANALSSISSLSLAINSLKVGDTNVIEAIKVDGTIQPPDASKTVNLNLGLSSFAKKTEVASGVRMKGSVDFFSNLANLPEPPAVGDLYNIKSAGGYDGDGTPILAGDNVVYTDKGTWDVMAGFIDTSRFVEKVAGKQLSTNDFTNADKAKLAGLSNYTLSTASKTVKGGIKVGDGLSMSGDTLNCTVSGGVGDDFKGATATKGGTSGIVPAPNAGDQDLYLRGNGKWEPIPTASTTEKGGVIVGAGLSMSGDTLNVTLDSGGSYDDFKGATSIAGGASGLVPAPLAGANEKFLCGNGKWEDISKHVSIVNAGGSIGVVIGKDPTAVQGALWMDYTSDGTAVLKLRRDDYEYNFIPDSSNYAGSALPALDTSNKGQIYYLGTTPATVNGGLWYEMDGDTPKLGMHYGKNLSFDFFYLPGSTTYKGDNTDLVAYLPLQSNVSDVMGNDVTSDVTPVIEQFTINGTTYRGLRNINTSSTGTGETTKKVGIITLKTPLPVYTVDFWLTILPSNTSNAKFAYLKSATTANKSGTLIYTYSNQRMQFYYDQNVFTGYSSGRYHIAVVHDGQLSTFYINGQPLKTTGMGAVNGIGTSSVFQATFGTGATGARCYIDHYRIWNKVVWPAALGSFDPPSMDSYV